MTLPLASSSENPRPDLFIGLVGAAGTDLDPVKNQITAQLASFEYDVREVKLSQLIAGLCNIDTDGVPEDQRIKNLMDGGDKIRAAYSGGDGVVCLAVAAIRKIRADANEAGGRSGRGVAYLIDSLKNPSEIKTLNALYGRNFYVVSVYSSEQDRGKRLANRIAKSCSTNVRSEHKELGSGLIDHNQ